MFQPVYYHCLMASPVGTLRLVASDKGLSHINFNGEQAYHQADTCEYKTMKDHPLLCQAKIQLEEYFVKKRHVFTLKLDIKGTVFQMKAWQQLQQIPYGKTISYGEQAQRVGDRNKARAVGAANGRNPLSIIIPCHRVIGASGAMVGFSSGVPIKKFLLDLEGVVA